MASKVTALFQSPEPGAQSPPALLRGAPRHRNVPDHLTPLELPLAVLAAASAVVVVAILGLAIRAPLAQVPENTMKFAVGVMLTAFGIFWGAEGAGVRWPGEDIALLVLIPAVALYALVLAALFKRRAPIATNAVSEGD